MINLDKLGFCGVDCASCPDRIEGKCPGCRLSEWPEGEECRPAACCAEKGLPCCGYCPDFPCETMQGFYKESEDHREAFEKMRGLSELRFITLRERPELEQEAAEWFHSKWRVPTSAYLECMDAYLSGETELGWYLCLDGERIVGGMGVIENDFHDRRDLAPNVCAVYTEEDHRCLGIAGMLLDLTVEDLRKKGISPVYLVTDHTGFYERYGWEFYCMVQGDGEPEMTRMYIHR